MALQGTLDTFALPDVLRLLAATTKTGRLQVNGDRGAGEVWLDHGGVVGGSTAAVTESTADVVFEMLRHVEGSFEFVAEDVAPGGHDPVDVDDVIRDAQAKLDHWRTIEAVVPSLDYWVTLVDELSGDQVVMYPDGWRTLVAIGEGRSVADIDTRLGLGEVKVSEAVKALLDDGVATIGEPAPVAAPVEELVEAPIEAAVDEPTDVAIDEPTELTIDEPGDVAAEDTSFDPTATSDHGIEFFAEPTVDQPAEDSAPVEDIQEPIDLDSPELAQADEEVEASGGSTDVDLDSALDVASDHHSYLTAGSDEATATMPEPLPATSELPAEPASDDFPAVAETVDEVAQTELPEPVMAQADDFEALDDHDFPDFDTPAAPAADGDSQESAEVGRHLSQLSPKAAQAIAAAAAGPVGDTAPEGKGKRSKGNRPEEPMNRNLLAKFISSK